jgi:sarcosine oxidase, subunit gamma
VNAVTARSPLDERSADLDRLDARELAFVSQLDVRTDPETAATLGFPVEPNTATTSGDRDVLWLGPDEWLVVGAPGAAGVAAAELGASLDGLHHSIVDVSANRAVIELAGPSRHDLLSSACPIDLHPRSWGDGRCAQSVFGAAQVLLHERDGATRLFVRPSFAAYVVDLLLVAARR